MSRYQLRSDIRVMIEPAEPAPFSVTETAAGYLLKFDEARGLRVRSGSTILFDGFRCELDAASQMKIFFQVDEALRIEDRLGRVWTVTCAFDRPQFKSRLQLPLFRATAVHLAFAVIALACITHGRMSLQGELLARQVSEAALDLGSFESALERALPFTGSSLHQFEVSIRAQASQAPDHARKTLAKTAGLLAGIFKRSVVDDLVEKRTAPVAAAPDLDTKAMLAHAAPAAAAPAAATAPTQQAGHVDPAAMPRESRLRWRLENLRPKLSQAFDEALRVDPALGATLTYEARVGANGELGEIRIHTVQASGASAGLATLEGKVREELSRFNVGKDFAGVRFRGEQVFLK